MNPSIRRKRSDHALTALCRGAMLVIVLVLAFVLVPVFKNGAGAYVFYGTVEYRKMQLAHFDRGKAEQLAHECRTIDAHRQRLYGHLRAFEAEIAAQTPAERRRNAAEYAEVKTLVRQLLGPLPGEPLPALIRNRYGATRMDRARDVLDAILHKRGWDYSGDAPKPVVTPRAPLFADTALAPAFRMLEQEADALLAPKLTFFPQFLTDASIDAHFFGGIGPEVAGTIYLTLGAMLIAVPFGVIAAIYFREYAADSRGTRFLRACVNTLAGVPSVVFGLFGLAFFINTLRVSPGKSVIAGALTLALLILPTIIRSAEEALAAVPHTYKEGAFALGAGRRHAIVTVILPAALPGILTGMVISMGRAAGETAPIIFTAAVSVGRIVRPSRIFTEATPALSWNLYNLCTEHEAAAQIAHVQYGMAATLVTLVLVLNLAAILLRARIGKHLKG